MTTKSELLKHQRENNDEGFFNYCEHCLKPNPFRLDEHHICFKSERPKHKNMDDSRNKILLCDKCHDWYHEKKSRRNDLINERGLTELFGTDIIRL